MTITTNTPHRQANGMTLDDAVNNWHVLSRSDAGRLLPAANIREVSAGRTFNHSDDPADESAWRQAYALWENLLVYSIAGHRSAQPLVAED